MSASDTHYCRPQLLQQSRMTTVIFHQCSYLIITIRHCFCFFPEQIRQRWQTAFGHSIRWIPWASDRQTDGAVCSDPTDPAPDWIATIIILGQYNRSWIKNNRPPKESAVYSTDNTKLTTIFLFSPIAYYEAHSRYTVEIFIRPAPILTGGCQPHSLEDA